MPLAKRALSIESPLDNPGDPERDIEVMFKALRRDEVNGITICISAESTLKVILKK